MKAKYLIIASLVLAILTIGAVSASEDVAVDDAMATSDVTEDPIGEAPVDEVIEQSEDSEPLEDISPSDFNVKIKDSIDLDDEDQNVINYTAPQGADGDVEVYVDYMEWSSHTDSSITPGDNYTVSLYQLNIEEADTYHIEVRYAPHEGNAITLAQKSLKVTKTYDKSDFSIDWESYIGSKDGDVVNVWNYPTEGTLIVAVNGDKRFNRTINDPDSDDIYVYLSNLNITSNGKYAVSAKFIVKSTLQEVDLGQTNVTVDVDWVTDEYVRISPDADILSHHYPVVDIEDYDDYLNGTVTVYIDGSVKFTKNIAASEEEVYVTVDDLGVYNNIALGKHVVKAVYMRNGVDKHEIEKSVEFYANPDFDYFSSLSVGEKETLVITYLKSFTGTATLYNAVWDDDEGEWIKGTVAGSAKFSNGVATIPFGSLSKGTHYFLVNITGYPYERDIDVHVSENTPGYSASVSASEITVGSNVVVKFNSPASTDSVEINVDGTRYVSVIASGAVSQEIKGLTVGTHKIKVFFDDGDKFYSNTFYVTVKNPTPAKKDTIKLTLKKVKVKKSAKKLVLQATLKINGKAVKGKVIKFKFNKKSYKAKTNKKGVAKVTVKKAVLKKLKVGKKVKIQATYGKTTKKLTVKVKK